MVFIPHINATISSIEYRDGHKEILSFREMKFHKRNTHVASTQNGRQDFVIIPVVFLCKFSMILQISQMKVGPAQPPPSNTVFQVHELLALMSMQLHNMKHLAIARLYSQHRYKVGMEMILSGFHMRHCMTYTLIIRMSTCLPCSRSLLSFLSSSLLFSIFLSLPAGF